MKILCQIDRGAAPWCAIGHRGTDAAPRAPAFYNMRSTTVCIAVASSLANGLVVQPSIQPLPMLHASRVNTPSMQFGFQNYDRTVEQTKRGSNPLNYLNPFATGSVVRSRHRLQSYSLTS